MKKFLLLFGIVISSLVFVQSVSADSGICNKQCQVNEECGQGYRCYVGICRALACPSSQTCGCAPVTTPVPTPKVATSILATPFPKATPMASVSAKIKKAPKTGGSYVGIFVMAIALSICGLCLRSYSEDF